MADIVELSPQTRDAALIDVQRGPGITRIVLTNPPANVLSIAMMEALKGALDACAADPDCRVVILAGKGETYCAGHDLKELTAHRGDADGGRAFFETTMRLCADLMRTIVRLPQPVIAEVGGFATAAGCQLVASCDLAIASEEAQFQTPGVHIGLFCSTPMVALSRNVMPKQAMEMLLTGERIDARSAREFGLVNRVVPPEYLGTIIGKYATTIAAKSALTVRTGKEAFYRQLEMPLSEAYDYTARVMVENMLAKDAEEGIGAFLDKRAPKWTNS
ncbi:enoyl-CoA hydratase [Fulvimarina sp. 2208YS6-2-32]|uniref:Enoyl-CoA hydratase domain-containing protein 3, mitochondrial n=1 Tax=Fulvimarina uroteuthidis TaxID=3098149 RepID=A0ABU5HYG0_9HYPH|nr:enoyl-CoA hydratase [Fulvimarina sp. 2208YS6-2-32]MDY8107808.1 enoyl-CoA hydratase [Fulvimarina sp. 2208YS6-2-32]